MRTITIKCEPKVFADVKNAIFTDENNLKPTTYLVAGNNHILVWENVEVKSSWSHPLEPVINALKEIAAHHEDEIGYNFNFISMGTESEDFESISNGSRANVKLKKIIDLSEGEVSSFDAIIQRVRDAVKPVTGKRNTPKYEYNGESKTLYEWAKEYNMACKTLESRVVRQGWSLERALTEPVREVSYAERIYFNGEMKTLTAWANELNIPRITLVKRIHDYGWSIERAFTTPAGSNGRRTVNI